MDATEAARLEAERLHRASVAAGGDPTRPLVFALQEASNRGLMRTRCEKETHSLREAKPRSTVRLEASSTRIVDQTSSARF